MVGKVSAPVIDLPLSPPIPNKGRVVLETNGNKIVTGPAPSHYEAMKKKLIIKALQSETAISSLSSELVVPRPDVSFCNFCGNSTRHCKLKYSGRYVFVSDQNTMLQFPSEKKIVLYRLLGFLSPDDL